MAGLLITAIRRSIADLFDPESARAREAMKEDKRLAEAEARQLAFSLLHKFWGEAKEGPSYNKREWSRFASALAEIGVHPSNENANHPRRGIPDGTPKGNSTMRETTLRSQEVKDILGELAEIVPSMESAIESHPTATTNIYLNGRRTLADGFDWFEASARRAGLTSEDQNLVRNYMLASSFMSAWYHVHGERTKRDKAANSCATLVAGLGDEPESVMKRYVELERKWRVALQSAEPAGSRWLTPSGISLSYPIVAALWMSQRAPLVESIGYGITQTAYLVGVTSIIFGTFRVLGVRSRKTGIVLAVGLFAVGVLLVNI